MHTPNDFARDLTESPPPVALSSTDMQVPDVEIPPETLAPPPQVETPEIVSSIAPSLAPKKKTSKTLISLVALIALSVGGYWFSHRNTEPKTTGTSSRASGPPNVTKITSANKAKLRAIWQQGAALKRSGNFARAREVWQQGLELDPQNVGFKQSIAKLPAGSLSSSGY